MNSLDVYRSTSHSSFTDRSQTYRLMESNSKLGDYWSRLGRWQSEKERWILICSVKPHSLLSADWSLCLRGRGIKPIVTSYAFLRASSAPQCTNGVGHLMGRTWSPITIAQSQGMVRLYRPHPGLIARSLDNWWQTWSRNLVPSQAASWGPLVTMASFC